MGRGTVIRRRLVRWAPAVVLACLLAVLTSAPAAFAAKPKPKGPVLSTFKLKGSHHYELEAISVREGTTAPIGVLTATRKGLSASYETTAEGSPGIHVDLGSLGRVDFDFHRRKRVAENVSKGCRLIVETGVFRGEFEFTGEGGYTHGAARSVAAEIIRLPDGFCLFDDLEGRARGGLFSATTLSARSRTANGSIEVEASKLAIVDRLSATATLREKVGGLKITRSASVDSAKNSLTIGAGKPPRSAKLKLSAPFTGQAEIQDPADGPPTWTGSLSVSLPGAPALSLTGEGFTTRLCVDKSLLKSCRADLPPAEVRPQPEL